VTETRDRWYRWLREVRHGGAAQLEQIGREPLPVGDEAVAYLSAAD